jgi:hypothetical protein
MKEEEGRRYKQEIKEVRARGGTSKRRYEQEEVRARGGTSKSFRLRLRVTRQRRLNYTLHWQLEASLTKSQASTVARSRAEQHLLGGNSKYQSWK